MQIGVLGTLEVQTGGRSVVVAGPMPRRLLALLASHVGSPVSVDLLIDGLWASPPLSARATLQSHIARLRRALGRPEIIIQGAGSYLLNLSPTEIDACAFVQAVDEGRLAMASANPQQAGITLRRGLALWRGPAYAEFAGCLLLESEARRLELLRVDALQTRIAADLAQPDVPPPVAELEALVQEFPTREPMWDLLMRALYRSGRQADALEAYQQARRLLVDELGIDPGPELRETERLILLQDSSLIPAGLSSGTAAQPAIDRTDHDSEQSPSLVPRYQNIPAPRSTFVGRQQELDLLGQALCEHRIVTLTGPGGSGKTRLALRAAAGLVSDFDDGTFLVELAALNEPASIAPQAAAALGVAAPGVAPEASIGQFLAERRALLLMDNCEHLLDDCAAFCDRLVSTSSKLTILATSREPLGIDGEHILRIPPLSQPQEQTAEAVASSECGELFRDRARAVQPGFDITALNAKSVAEICRRLDGIPLAIELAAARVRHLSPHQIAERLDNRFRLLTGGQRTSQPRQRTLEATIDWSYDLLDPDEQALLRRLSVFVGPFSLDAAEAVGSDDRIDHDWVLELLSRLVDRSLVVAIPGDQKTRYGLLESVRDYGQSKLLALDETVRVRDKHRAWYADQARASWLVEREAYWRGPLQFETPENYEDLMAAFRSAVDCMSGEEALALTGPLINAWGQRADKEAEVWLSILLEAPWVPDGPERAAVANAFAGICSYAGDFALGLTRYQKALDYARATGCDEEVPEILVGMGITTSVVRNIDEAISYLDEATAAAVQVNRLDVAVNSACMSAWYRLGSDPARAAADLDQLVGSLPDEKLAGREILWATIGLARLFVGDVSRAAMAIAGIADRIDVLEEQIFRRGGLLTRQAEIVLPLTVTLAGTARYSEAKRLIRRGRRTLEDVPLPLMETAYLVAAGAVEIFGGDAHVGLQLLGCARSRFGEEGAWRAPVVGAVYLHARTRGRELLEEGLAKAAWQDGMAMSPEQVFAIADF